jgi:hypothetical protein
MEVALVTEAAAPVTSCFATTEVEPEDEDADASFEASVVEEALLDASVSARKETLFAGRSFGEEAAERLGAAVSFAELVSDPTLDDRLESQPVCSEADCLFDWLDLFCSIDDPVLPATCSTLESLE